MSANTPSFVPQTFGGGMKSTNSDMNSNMNSNMNNNIYNEKRDNGSVQAFDGNFQQYQNYEKISGNTVPTIGRNAIPISTRQTDHSKKLKFPKNKQSNTFTPMDELYDSTDDYIDEFQNNIKVDTIDDIAFKLTESDLDIYEDELFSKPSEKPYVKPSTTTTTKPSATTTATTATTATTTGIKLNNNKTKKIIVNINMANITDEVEVVININ